MALFIKQPEADRLARRLAKLTGETLTDAVVVALRERLARQPKRAHSSSLADDLRAIGRRCAARAILDPRSPEDIIGYGPDGMPS